VQQYGVREVEKLLQLPRSTLRALVKAGFVSPTRGQRNAWLFSFQDLIVLRTAQALAAANVPRARITRSVKELRRRLPSSMPLSGLSIGAVGDRVVVREGSRQWQAESGQYLLAFEGDPASGALKVIPAQTPERAPTAEEWFENGAAVEEHDRGAAIEAYKRAIAADPSHVDARLNLGSVLHDEGRLQEAEAAYRAGIEACGDEPLLLYNLGVLLEDLGRKAEAFEAYKFAVRADPQLADAHYNLALLCDELKRPMDAIRHMAQYRKLAGKQSG
jgi:tetratricopeptide (TPR) repeat protein